MILQDVVLMLTVLIIIFLFIHILIRTFRDFPTFDGRLRWFENLIIVGSFTIRLDIVDSLALRLKFRKIHTLESKDELTFLVGVPKPFVFSLSAVCLH